MKLIKLSDNHYIVVDDSEIGEGDYVYFKGRIIGSNILKVHLTEDDGYTLLDDKGLKVLVHKNTTPKITHSTQPLENGIGKSINGTYPSEYPRFDKIKPLSLLEIEEAIYGYNVEKMAKYHYGFHRKTLEFEDGFMLGFQIAHKELVKDKLSVNQVIDFYNWLKKSYGSVKPLEEAQIIHRTTPDKIVEMYLQSLKEQTEWNIEFDEQGKIVLL